MCARQDDLHATARLANFDDDRPNPLADAMRFAGNLLALGEKPVDLAEADQRRPSLKTGDRAVDQLPLEFFVLVVDRIPLRFADALHHDLFGSLSGDASENLAQHVRFNVFTVTLHRGVAREWVDRRRDLKVFAEMLLG